MNSKLAVNIACCSPLLILLLASQPSTGLSCFRTKVGSTPHPTQCGSLARGCRIIIKPYKDQNNSAVAQCNNKQLAGRYLYDCAVECPPNKEDRHWNEVECCTGDKCNTGDNLKNQRKCYVSKGKKSTEYDSIQSCNAPKRCGVNLKTEETKCLDAADCEGGDWKCCTEDECLNRWGVEKVSMRLLEEKSTDATSLTPSLAVAFTCLLVYRAVALPVSA